MKKVVFYLNQFFGQIGGEDKADYPPHLEAKAVGAAAAFSKQLKNAEVTHTLICGDNYYNEKKDAANDFIRSALEEIRPDLLIAGPAFNAGRYGMACAGVTELAHELSIPAISGMYEENPGVEMARKYCLIVATADSSSHMREALKDLAALAQKCWMERTYPLSATAIWRRATAEPSSAIKLERKGLWICCWLACRTSLL